MALSTRAMFAALLASASLTACGGSRGSVESAPAPRILGNPEAIAKARPDSNRFPFTEADVNFMAGMIGHHAQAIVMSKMAPTNGASPSIQTLAGRIINAQQDEIALMERWLRDRKQPVPEPTATGVKMQMGGMNHEMSMSGMLTEEQLKQLSAARGKDFDELFLRFMIQHHQGAVGMVKELFATPGAGQDEATFKLASDISADQDSEIARMQRMLFTLKVEGRTP